jgi:hypothetical protein
MNAIHTTAARRARNRAMVRRVDAVSRAPRPLRDLRFRREFATPFLAPQDKRS